MLSKRIIACLDVRNGKLAKSVKFVDTQDIGDPVKKAQEYYDDGLDELVFYDITASSDCLLYTSPSPRDLSTSRMPSSA